MSRFDAAHEVEAWSTAADEVAQLLAGPPATLTRRATGVSGWSAVDHAAHVTLASELVLRNLVSLARGSGLLVVEGATQNPEALALLERGALPRGQARSPRMVVPPADIEVATAREWAERFVEELAAFRRGFDPRAARPGLFVPHQALGPLDLSEWARFGRVHTRHHLAIAREVLAALA